MSVNYREPQWLLPNEKNLQYPAAGATQGSGLSADRHSLYSMDFGVNKDIELPNTLEVQPQNGDFTFSAWINPDSWSSSAYDGIYVTAGANGLWIGVGPVGGTQNFILRAYGVANYIEYNVLPSIGTWTHVCITRINNQATLYYNGVSVATGSANKNFSASAKTHIGSDSFNSFNGKIDEVAFWKGKGLSLQQVQSLSTSDNAPANIMALSNKPTIYYPLGEQARKPGTAEWRFPNEVLQGQAMEFDGSTDFIDVDTINLGTTFTVSCWVNFDSFAATKNVIFGGGSSNYALYIPNGTTIWGNFSGSFQAFTVPAISTGSWYNIVLTRNGANGELFINGQSQGTTTSFGSSDFNLNFIGCENQGSGTNYNLDGKLSNAVVWDTDQSANIANIYNYGAPQTSYTVTPTAWYKLNATSNYAGLNPNWHNALDFGVTDYVDCGVISAVEGVSTFSMAAWVYPTNGAIRSVISNWGTPYIGVAIQTSSSAVYFVVDNDASGGGYGATSSGLTNDTWNHIMLVFDGSGSTNADKLKGYINGVEQSLSYTGTIAATTATPNRSFRIGDAHVGDGLIGNISNAAIWDQPISAEDVLYLYNGGTPQTSLSFEPTSWWKLDNLTTGIQDSGSASNNGTNNGATAVSSSVAVDQWNFDNAVQSQTPNWSSALDFDGSSDYVDCGSFSALNSATQMSFSVWFNLDTSVINKGIIGDNVHFDIYTKTPISGSDYSLRLNLNGSSNRFQLTGSPFTAGKWHNLVTTFNAGTLNFYIDGNLAAYTVYSGSIPTSLSSSTGQLEIGRATASLYWDGLISNTQIWTTELSAADALSIYNSGQPNTTAFGSPVSWYKLNNTSSAASTDGLYDNGSASNNGTNNGATEIQTNVWTPRLNGESSTLPSSALISSDLQFNSAYSSFSLNFDQASNTYINCGGQSLFNGLTAFSISCWIKTDGTQQDYAAIFSYQSSTSQYVKLAFYPSEKDRIRVVVRPGSSNPNYVKSSAGSIVDDEWVHIVAVGDANNLSNLNVYINGVLDNDVTQGNITTLAQSSDIYIGTDASATTTRDFNGKIDETAVWNRALNQAEITSIYNNGYPKDLTALSPISWWRLGEDAYFNGNDFIIPNKISGAPNGTSNGMPATALVADAPGSYAAGLGSSLVETDRLGEAPLSTANSLSFNMTPINRVSYPAGYVPTQADNVYSMNFDGSSDYVDLTDKFSFIHNTKNFSISLWLKMDSYNATVSSVLVGNNYTGSNIGFQFWIDNRQNGTTRTNALKFNLWDGTNTAELAQDSVVVDNNWNNYVVTGDGTTLKYYRNGIQLANTDSLPVATSTIAFANTILGANTASPKSAHLDGNIDEVAIFDYALSARQIKQDIYDATTTGKTADLNNISNLTAPVAWYRMGD